jgi:hypothetical protein
LEKKPRVIVFGLLKVFQLETTCKRRFDQMHGRQKKIMQNVGLQILTI